MKINDANFLFRLLRTVCESGEILYGYKNGPSEIRTKRVFIVQNALDFSNHHKLHTITMLAVFHKTVRIPNFGKYGRSFHR